MGSAAPLRKVVPPATKPRGDVRWFVCGLLFYATTVNYVDRQVLGLLKPIISRELRWSEADFGWIIFAFQTAYAFTMPVAGRMIDKLGTRLGYVLAVFIWSVAAMSHALAHSLAQFIAARFVLGIGEAGNFPAAIKTVAAWFPKRERALATGIFNSGSNVGALVAPLLIPFIAVHFGWRFSFLGTSFLDLLWIALWWTFYRPPQQMKRLSVSERTYIESDGVAEHPGKIPYARLLKTRAAWAVMIAKFMTDPVWWFYLYWLPGFLNRKYSLDLTKLGPPLVVVYLAADFGSIGGGWLSSRLLALGQSVTRARKTALLTCALAVLPVTCVMFAGGNLWLTVALVSLAGAAHQGWSANVYTVASDTFPTSAVGSVMGLGGFGGAIGGMLVAPAVGYWLDFSHGSYGPLFIIAGTMYLVAFCILHVLLPRLDQVVI
jgi:ACS family hexuronate transporter-like MFS transporter